MRLSFSAACKQPQPLVNFPGGLINMEPFLPRRRKDKVVVVMGATGTGKSRLSIDLATQFPAEIINSDKMQVYKGLDIVTNKVTEEECCGVPHHLLGFVDPNEDFSSVDFRHHASLAVESIIRRGRLPIIAGGSNSYIKSLINHDIKFQSSRYDICYLWIDVSLPVLHSFVSGRVDRMVEAGLVDEVRSVFDPQADYTRGIRQAIGVPEMDRVFRAESAASNDMSRTRLLELAVDEIKANTCKLASRQFQNIVRLRNHLDQRHMHCLDATDALIKRGNEAEEAWEKLVAAPSAMIVRRFLYEDDFMAAIAAAAPPTSIIGAPTVAVAAATH
ncbi:adenylate isopentenyltransferase 5, chloroplastic [Cornus florida]|uniref:adenylate isopentenyltransferase 5, chloroplastic n=1 Tax=Cornus florida TaxID=4283 RepID=UPI0028A059AB|nr:adenylate isopentenyltransferase 5, chloroplastic [Cornus florida]